MLEFELATRTPTRRRRDAAYGGSTLRDSSTSTAAAYRHGGTSRPLAAMPTGRSFRTATRMADGRVLILGGDEANGGAVEFVLICD